MKRQIPFFLVIYPDQLFNSISQSNFVLISKNVNNKGKYSNPIIAFFCTTISESKYYSCVKDNFLHTLIIYTNNLDKN